MPIDLEFRYVPVDSGDGAAMVAAMTAGTFLVGYTADGVAVCGGGLKRLPDGACGGTRDR